ncbi:C-terminal binding protein [Salicibibacter cibi]|uniref:C-terminal binding protein n=1 Tax=Salicibibacter cibi TaxID=2743001 RepID=A0A7T6Z8J8_9BACI|nr:C-terminal binding protein [Salicibibacter cibi]QQK78834.1 C-terminal binding protein [Salicibibacter cibi]
MAKWKVVISDYEFSSLQPEEEVFSHGDIEFIKKQCRTEDEVISACQDADGIITQYAPFPKKVLDALPKCKVISRYGVGVNTIDVEIASKHGIVVSNVTDYCMDEVSDHAFALILAAARKIAFLDHTVKKRVWNFNEGRPIYRLRGQTLGLLGFGKIPQTLTLKAQAFGLNIIAYDPYADDQVARDHNVELVDLSELCRSSDFISVHAPLTESTRGMISTEQFEQMKTEAFIINTARGPVIDEKALAVALEEYQIAGVALDVVEEEPIPLQSPLLDMNQVTLTPHIAWYSEESQAELKRKTAENVLHVLNGRKPDYFFNQHLIESPRMKLSENHV